MKRGSEVEPPQWENLEKGLVKYCEIILGKQRIYSTFRAHKEIMLYLKSFTTLIRLQFISEKVQCQFQPLSLMKSNQNIPACKENFQTFFPSSLFLSRQTLKYFGIAILTVSIITLSFLLHITECKPRHFQPPWFSFSFSNNVVVTKPALLASQRGKFKLWQLAINIKILFIHLFMGARG